MKNKMIACLLVVSASIVLAQPYGQTHYPNGAQLMSGQQVNLNSQGFLMGGIYNPNNDEVISITKTDQGGVYNGTPSEFKKHYKFMRTGANNCTPGTTPVLDYSGVSVIEINPGGNGEWYALASAFDDGVIFSTLKSTGVPVATSLYKFSAPAGQLNKPTIIESSTTPGDFYICGKYDTVMYVIKTAIGGGVYWSHYYHAGGGMIEPRDMIISVHNNNLIVVGHVTPDPQYGRASDGFLLDLDPATGNVNNFVDYSSTPCNWFNSIKNSNYNGNGMGYIVGGYTDPFINAGGALVMKLDVNGGIIWNTLLQGNVAGAFTNEVLDVAERQNTMFNYEYYATARSINLSSPQYDNISVFKLDFNGAPAAGPNEFFYAGTSSLPLTGVKIDYQNPATGFDQGVHIYANNGNNFYLIESYFNGYTGCNEFFSQSITETGPIDINPWIGKYGSFTQCSGQSLVDWDVQYTPTIICSNNSVVGGNNQKTTGLSEAGQESRVKAYPNPSNGQYFIENDSQAHVKVVNTLGQVVFEKNLQEGQNQIDIGKFPSGIYTLWLKDASGCSSQQLIKE